MFDHARDHYAGILAEIRSAGLYKDERILESPQGPEITVGRDTGGIFAGDSYLSPKHAIFRQKPGKLSVEDQVVAYDGLAAFLLG